MSRAGLSGSRLLLAGALLLLSGCASIVGGKDQSLAVAATDDQGAAVDAECSLSNDEGHWSAAAPGKVTVRRSYGDMSVSCRHEGLRGASQVKSTTRPMAFGNIIFGGLIGAGVDIATGSAYDYPDPISIQMTGAKMRPGSATATGQALAPLMSGTAAWEVEHLQAVRTCHPQPVAAMTEKGPGFENYTVTCTNGSVLAVHCEFGNCRALK